MKESLVKTASAVSTAVFGGSSGPEGASAILGGGLLVWASKIFKSKIEPRKALLIGVAAGISATFKTPLAGALFALELPYRRDIEIEPFINAVLASSSAYLVSVVLNSPPLLNIHLEVIEPPLFILPVSMVFGFVTGGVVYLFTNAYRLGETSSKKMLSRGGYPFMILIGGTILGVIGFLDPNSMGPGHQLITFLGNASFTSLILILLLKPICTIVTMNFGGSGGLLYQTIIIGGAWGALVSSIFAPQLLPLFILMGMSSFSSGVHKTILAPIIFIAEAFGTESMIPVILATVICYFIVSSTIFYPVQPLTKTVEEELALERFYYKVIRAKPKELDKIKVSDVMTPNPIRLRSEITVKEAFEEFSKTSFRIMPVVDEYSKLIGYVKLEELAHLSMVSFDKRIDEVSLHKPLTLEKDEKIRGVIEKMIENSIDHAFVIDDQHQLIGIVSDIDLVRILLRYYTNL
ncbi:chloride channel protein [Candidatus Bathyarchaeota archaeon]|nr:chloride channel protein [Candidatus Bathyarchaeota archaeon]